MYICLSCTGESKSEFRITNMKSIETTYRFQPFQIWRQPIWLASRKTVWIPTVAGAGLEVLAVTEPSANWGYCSFLLGLLDLLRMLQDSKRKKMVSVRGSPSGSALLQWFYINNTEHHGTAITSASWPWRFLHGRPYHSVLCTFGEEFEEMRWDETGKLKKRKADEH